MPRLLKSLFIKLPRAQSEWLQGCLWMVRAALIRGACPIIRILTTRCGGRGLLAAWPKGVIHLRDAKSATIHPTHICPVAIVARATTIGDANLNDFADEPKIADPVAIAALPQATVDGRTAAVLDDRSRLIVELSQYSQRAEVPRPWDHPLFFKFGRARSESLDGTCLLLANPNASVYFHWLLELLPILLIARNLNIIPQNSRCLISSKPTFVRDSLAMAGVADEQIILMRPDTRYRVDNLLASTTLQPQSTAAHLAPLLKETFLKNTSTKPSTPKLIYISRRDSGLRMVANEDILISIIENLGGRAVMLDGMSIADQAAIFHHADCIVAPHGSAFTNLVFCRTQTNILELFSPAYVRLLYPRIGTSLNLNYHYLIGRGQREKSGSPRLYASIDIDPALFEKTLCSILNKEPQQNQPKAGPVGQF